MEIPNSVTTLGNEAFSGCWELASIIIGNGITNLGEKTFSYCTKLLSVTLPNTITSISSTAFVDCPLLEDVVINLTDEEDFKNYLSREDLWDIYHGPHFKNRIKTHHITLNGEALTEITIPSGVTLIGNSAFRYCKDIVSVTIPEGVTTIKADAFEDCINMRKIYCNCDNPPLIENYAFYGINKSSTNVYVSYNSLSRYKTDGSWNVFNIQTSGMETTIDNITYWLENSTAMVLTGVPSNHSITIPERLTLSGVYYTVTGIADNAFNNIYDLMDVTLPTSIESIGEKALRGVTVYCYAENPPAIQENTFSQTSACYVPVGRKTVYRQSQYWDSFPNLWVMHDNCEYDDVEWEWNGIESATAKLTCKIDDEEVYIANAKISSQVVSESTCTDDGVMLYTAEAVFEELDGEPKYFAQKEVIIPKLAHTETIVNNEDETHSFICTTCGNAHTEPHTYTDGYCKICGAVDAMPDTNLSGIDNIIYAMNTKVVPGNSATVKFRIKNETPMTGFQFKVSIPFADLSEAVVSPDITNNNISFRSAMLSDGTIKVLCYTTDGEYLNASDDIICLISFPVDDKLPYKDYPVTVSGIRLTQSGDLYKTGIPIKSSITLSQEADDVKPIEIMLVDGSDYSNTETMNVDALTFTKTFSASAVGNWNAFYVPMSIDVEEYEGELDFAEIYAFCATVDTNGDGTVNADDENYLFVRPVKTGCIEANVPYLIRPHEAKTYTINSADNILHKAENGCVEFSTTLDKFTVTGLNEAYNVVAGDNNYYVSATGKLNYRTTGSTSVKANRWIMHRESKKYGSNSSAASEAKEYRIIALGEDVDEADAVEMIRMTATSEGNSSVYAIDGMKMNSAGKLQKGLYIQNGKKYIVK